MYFTANVTTFDVIAVSHIYHIYTFHIEIFYKESIYRVTADKYKISEYVIIFFKNFKKPMG